MLHVRSLSSIRVFPRISLALFLVFHFYRYSYPTGFHSLALFVMFLLSLWSMVFCLYKYEIPAYCRGDVSYDRPRWGSNQLILTVMCSTHWPLHVYYISLCRALYNYMPWPAWAGALPPDHSLFQPLSHRSVGVYQAQVPHLHPEPGPADAPRPPTATDANTASHLNAPLQEGRSLGVFDRLAQLRTSLFPSASGGYSRLHDSAAVHGSPGIGEASIPDAEAGRFPYVHA